MKSNRDNFKPSVIRTLREQVAYRCSNPDCRVPTAGPGQTKDRVNRVGQAAHITAASPEGPRYDALLTPDERRSESNGIWLCNNCAKKIDNSETEYPVKILREWKRIALTKARAELGKTLPDEKDAVNLLTTALTGNPTDIQYAPAIKSVHAAASNILAKNHPGFHFETSYFKDNIELKITSEKPISFNFTSKDKDALEKYRSIFEKGKPAELDIENITHDGPSIIPLPDSFGKLKISPQNSKEATTKLSFKDKEKNTTLIDDINGLISPGSKGGYFYGTVYGELIKAEYVAAPEVDAIEPLKLTVNYQSWNMQDCRKLKYFNKVRNLLFGLGSCIEAQLKLEIEGEFAFSASMTNNENFKSENLYLLELLGQLREFCIETEQSIYFDNNKITDNDQVTIEAAFDDLDFKKISGIKDLEKNPTLKGTIDIDRFNEQFRDKNVNVLIEQNFEGPFTIMEQPFNMPKLVHFFVDVNPKIKEVIDDNGLCEIELIAGNGFEYYKGFNIPRNKKLLPKRELDSF